MSYNFSEILVTGGAGFIGSHLVGRLLEEGFKVRVVDNLSTGEIENLTQHEGKQSFQFIEGDIRNSNLLKKVIKGVDAVFHEAALVSVPSSIENPLLTNEVNVTGTVNLLNACVDFRVKRIVFASSCSVYGNTAILPNHENLVPMPLSPYAVSKLAAEDYVRVFQHVYGIETVVLRYFNVYGPRQKYGPYSGVIPIFIDRILETKPPTIYGDGEQTRDFVNVKDVVEANLLTLSKREAAGDVINIGTGEAVKVNTLARILLKIMGKVDLEPVYAEARLGDISNSYADISKARKILGYEPMVKLEDGIKELVEGYRKNS